MVYNNLYKLKLELNKLNISSASSASWVEQPMFTIFTDGTKLDDGTILPSYSEQHVFIYPRGNIDYPSKFVLNDANFDGLLTAQKNKTDFHLNFVFPSIIDDNAKQHCQKFADENNGKTFNVNDEYLLDNVISSIDKEYTYYSGILNEIKLKKPISSDMYKASLGEITDLSRFTDSDEDGLYDFEEINFKYIEYDGDNIVLPTYKEIYITLNLNLNAYTEYENYLNNKFVNFSLPIVPLRSDPNKDDTDKDDILDNIDPNPFKAFDKRFQIINSYDIDIMDIFPYDYVAQMLKNMLTWGEKLVNDFSATEFAAAGLTCDVLVAGALGGYIPFCAPIFGVDSLGSTPNGANALLNYLLKREIYYKFEDFDDAIRETYSQRQKFYEYMNLLFENAENMVDKGERMIISTTNKANLGIGFHSYTVNKAELDWWLAVKGAQNGIVADVECIGNGNSKYAKNTYSAKVKFYLFDVYDFDPDCCAIIKL